MKKALLLSAVAAVGLAAQANAAQIALTVEGIAAYNNTTAYTPVPFNPTLNPATTGVVYELPIYFTLSGLSAGQSFGNLSFNVLVNGSAVANIGGGPYAASTQTYTSGKTQVPYYSINGDQNNATDLQGIVASFPQGTASAPRAAAGVGSPFFLGYVYVDLPAGATTNGVVTIVPTQFSVNNNGTLQIDTGGTLTGSTVNFIVPEPASMGLAGVGALGLLARRRRQA